MNKTILTGRTTRSIDLRTTKNGKSVTNFSLAVDSFKRDEPTEFYSCTAWGTTAELLDRYVNKGDKIGIVGHLHPVSYEKDGVQYKMVEIIVEQIEFLGGRRPEHGGTPVTENEPELLNPYRTDPDVFDSDLPF